MAYRPSKRSKRGEDDVQPNITPMMNLMVVLIPLLLSSAEFVKLGVIEINLPPAQSGPAQSLAENMPQEENLRLDLAVTITGNGFVLSSSMGILGGAKDEKTTIGMVNNQYDFKKLSETLYEIKQKAEGKFPDTDQIIIMGNLNDNIDYQTVVSTMDASRSIRVDGQIVELFPEVSLSAGVM